MSIELATTQLSDMQREGLHILAEHTGQDFDPTRPIDVQYACEIAENARQYFYGNQPNILEERPIYEQVNPVKTFYNNAAALAADFKRNDLADYYNTKAGTFDVIPGGYVSEYDLKLLTRLIKNNIDSDFSMPKSETAGGVYILPKALNNDI